MRSGLLFLPFLSFFAGVLALATDKSYASMPYIGIGLWLLAAICLLAWLILDAERIGKMFRNKGAKHGMSQGLSVILALLLAVGVGFITKRERFNKSFDFTKDGLNTLSPESAKLTTELKTRPDIVSVVAFFQDEGKKAQFTKLISMYQNTGTPFRVEFIDPQTDPARAMAESVTVPDTVIFKLGKQESRLTSFSEEKMSNALVRVMKEKEKTVYFLGGHGEPDIESKDPVGLSLAKAELESERFKVKQAKLLELGKYPEDADLVIIAGPRYDILPSEKVILEQAMQNAKPVMFLVDALVNLPNIKSLVADAGIRFNDDLLIIRPEDPRVEMLGQNNSIVTDLDKFSPITSDFAKRGNVALITANTRSLSIEPENKLHMKPIGLAKTATMIIKVKGVSTPADVKGGIKSTQIETGSFDVFAVSTGQVGSERLASNDGKNDQDLKADKGGKGSKELRVFVGGTSQLVANQGAQRGENLDLFVNAVNYLMQDEDFLSIRAKDIDASRLDLASSSSQFLLIFLSFIYPIVFFGAGGFVWLQRRRA